jgi:hypothetical protein
MSLIKGKFIGNERLTTGCFVCFILICAEFFSIRHLSFCSAKQRSLLFVMLINKLKQFDHPYPHTLHLLPITFPVYMEKFDVFLINSMMFQCHPPTDDRQHIQSYNKHIKDKSRHCVHQLLTLSFPSPYAVFSYLI